MSSLRHKLHHLISGQIPEYVRDNFPVFVAFIEAYYRFLEESGEVHDVLLNSDSWMDIDATLDDFIPEFQKEFIGDIPQTALIDIRRLIKIINQFYEVKGTENGAELFFRFMFNDQATVKYPGDFRLVASGGNWKEKKTLKVDTTTFPEAAHNPFDMAGRVIRIHYTTYENGIGEVEHDVPFSCLGVYKLAATNIYKLDVEMNPDTILPDNAIEGGLDPETESLFDSHLYVQMNMNTDLDPVWSTCGILTKQLISVNSFIDRGSNFRVGETFFVNEGLNSGDYFRIMNPLSAGRYLDVVVGEDAYILPALEINNGIIRITALTSENKPLFMFFNDETGGFVYDTNDDGTYAPYTVESLQDQIKRLQIIATGQRFAVREWYWDYDALYLYDTDNYTNDQFPYFINMELLRKSRPVTTVTSDFNSYVGGWPATIVFNTGYLYTEPGKYVDNSGMISDTNRLQDNFFYQPYSYVVHSHQPMTVWETPFIKNNHPAGFIVFGNLNIEDTQSAPVTVIDEDMEFIMVSPSPTPTPTPT